MSESIFGDLDVAGAADNPFEVPDDTYETFVTKAEIKESKAGNKGLALTYRIASGDHEGKNISEWKNIPIVKSGEQPTAEDKSALSWLKQRLLSLGVPESRMNSLSDPQELVGTHVYVTTKTKDGYTNVRNVELVENVEVTAGANPFA
jgi:hypothetical protein